MSARVADGRHYANPARARKKSEAHEAAAASASSEFKSADTDDATRVTWLSSQLSALLESVSEHASAQAGGRSETDDDEEAEQPDETLYEGVGGAAYAFLHVSRSIARMHHTPPKAVEALQPLSRRLPGAAFTLADRAAAMHAASRHRPRVTFYMGTAGILVTRILSALHTGDSKRMQSVETDLAALLAIKHSDPTLPNEILYGRAGLLHALLLLSSELSGVAALAKHLPALRAKQDAMFDEIVSQGQAFRDKPKSCPLMWAWHDKRYLGAAHGVTGILTALMQCTWRFKGEDAAAARLRSLVEGTLDFCISIRLPSGNFPSSLPDDPRESSSDRLCQWCHGAPGLVFACLAAYDLWGQRAHLDAALQSAEVVWERGLLKKGLGLCHGIGGNAFVFLRLYDATRDRTHLDRAYSFLHFGLAGPHRVELMKQPDVPDSLGNGKAGCACAVADCMRLLNEAAQTAGAGADETGTSSSAAAAPAAASSKVLSTRSRSSFPGMDARLP